MANDCFSNWKIETIQPIERKICNAIRKNAIIFTWNEIWSENFNEILISADVYVGIRTIPCGGGGGDQLIRRGSSARCFAKLDIDLGHGGARAIPRERVRLFVKRAFCSVDSVALHSATVCARANSLYAHACQCMRATFLGKTICRHVAQ